MDPISTGIISSAAYDALKQGKKFLEPGFWGFIVETVDELGEKYHGVNIDIMKEFFFDEKISKQVNEYRTKGTKIDFDKLVPIFEQICKGHSLTIDYRETLRDFFNYLETKLVSKPKVFEKIKLTYFQEINKKADKILDKEADILQGQEDIKKLIIDSQEKIEKPKIKLEAIPKYFKGETKNFVGRKKEIDNLVSILKKGNKVIAIVGEGGLGKSSLAVKSIHSCKDEFDLIIPLYLDLSLTLDEFLTEFSLRLMIPQEEFLKQTNDHKIEIIMNEIGKKNKVLIYVDNYETISGKLKSDSPPGGLVRINNFLENVPKKTSILVTSREKNNLTNEVTYELEGLTEEDGFSLFTNLASKNLHNQKNEIKINEKIKSIIKKVGGHPLAIELLARSYKGKGTEELDSMLTTLGIGVTNSRSSEERLKSLEACFDYSIKFIDKDLEELLLKLTVFNSSFPSKIVEKAFNSKEELLNELYEHSLLQRIENDEFGDLDREFWLYDIHPIIRAYLEKKLQEKSNSDIISGDQLGKLFGEFLSECRDQLDSEKRGMVIRQFSLMIKRHPNDIHHYAELIENENVKAQYFGLAALLYHHAGLFKVSNDCYEKVLSIFDLSSFPVNLIPILGNYSLLLSSVGDYEKSIEYQKRVAEIYEAENNHEKGGIAYNNIGLTMFRSGKRSDAIKFCRKAIEFLEKTENKASLANAYLNYGNTIRNDDPDKSIEYLEKAKNSFEKLNDPRRLSVSYSDLASSYRKKDDTKSAINCLNKALAINEEQHEKLAIALTHLDFGITYNVMEDYPNAKKHLVQCLPIFKDLEDFVHLIEYHIQMAQILFREKDLKSAMSSFQMAFDLAKKIGIKNDQIRVGMILAGAYSVTNKFKESLSYIKYILPFIKELKNPQHILLCKDLLGKIKTELEKQEEAALLDETKKLLKQL